MDLPKSIKWTTTVEEYLRDIGEKAFSYGILHRQAEACFSRRTQWIDLPVIVLSTVSGTLSIGSSNLFAEDDKRASQFIGLLSLFVSVLSTVGSYFGWAQRTQAHRISALTYLKLSRFIQVELSLPRDERMQPGDLLKVTRDIYERQQETSPLIPNHLLSKFKKKFKNYDVAKPSETNGLERIVIYNPKLAEQMEREEVAKSERSTGSDSLPRSGRVEDFIAAV